MSKKIWGIILIILGIAAIAGSFANGTFENMDNSFELIGFFAAAAVMFFFGIKFIRKG